MGARNVFTPFLLSTWVAACGGGSTDGPTAGHDGVEEPAPPPAGSSTSIAPPPPENGMEIISSGLEVPPGEEIQSCYYTTLPNEEEEFVQRFAGYQSTGGHHITVFTSLQPKPDGTIEDCTDGAEMVNFLPLFIPVERNALELPDGFAVRVPPRAQVVLQSHYVNTTSEPLAVEDVVQIEYVEPGTVVTPAGFWASIYADLSVPPLRSSTVTYRCVADRDVQLLTLVGHMHSEGATISIDLGPPGAMERAYSVDAWDPSFRDTPPQVQWSFEEPFSVRAGDTMEVTCNYASEAAGPLAFPVEMCGTNAFFYPADDSIGCLGEFVAGDATISAL